MLLPSAFGYVAFSNMSQGLARFCSRVLYSLQWNLVVHITYQHLADALWCVQLVIEGASALARSVYKCRTFQRVARIGKILSACAM